ncbi:hypothetical protein F4808DRAFT_472445 [Astrocystis sublimbata]|nr:hypothetical protein F4808DRAFT_472445 [Astrocystis sublimbata]
MAPVNKGKLPNPPSSKSETSCKWQSLDVIVFFGDPVDGINYRHTGLLVQSLSWDGSILQRTFLHVTGAHGFFEREERERDPRNSTLFAGVVPVATVPVSGLSYNRLRNEIWATAVNNAESGWNCQTWVGDALDRCVKAGFFDQDRADDAIDGMTDIIMRAKDDD